MQDTSNYDKIRQDAENFYKKIGKVLCPVFNELIYFNAEGFNHLVYKSSHSERDKNVQIAKFKMLARAKELVAKTTTYQEYDESIKEFEVKKFKKKIRESKRVRYWGIIAIMNGWKIKVIIRQIGDNGLKHFWSIIPNWTTNQYRDIKLFSSMKGNPDED